MPPPPKPANILFIIGCTTARLRKVAIISDTIDLVKFLKDSKALSPSNRSSAKSLERLCPASFTTVSNSPKASANLFTSVVESPPGGTIVPVPVVSVGVLPV